MNYVWYSNGNPFKVMFRKHYCPTCGNILSKTRHKKLVNKNSPEAKYYAFDSNIDAVPIGNMRTFIHKVFDCPYCKRTFEYVTQTNLEDIDILIEKVKKEYIKFSNISPKKLTVKKMF